MAERKKSTEELVQVEVELSSWDGRLPLNLEVIFGNPIHHGSIRCLQHRQRHLSWEGHSVMFLAAHEEIWEGLSSSYDFITVTGHHWAKLRSSWQARCCRSRKSFASRIFLDKEAVEITALLPQKKLRVLHCLKSMHLSKTLADTCRSVYMIQVPLRRPLHRCLLCIPMTLWPLAPLGKAATPEAQLKLYHNTKGADMMVSVSPIAGTIHMC